MIFGRLDPFSSLGATGNLVRALALSGKLWKRVRDQNFQLRLDPPYLLGVG